MADMKANDIWLETLDELLQYGRISKPRKFTCVELLNYHTTVQMEYPIVTINERNIGYRFMFAEAYWILTGDNRLETIEPYSKIIKNFSDNGKTFFGAYGPKVIDQIPYICDVLANDQWSRQAVMNIWRENPPRTKDVPCTISVQFFIRDDKLYCIDTMRSSDIWLGWPYDVFNFSMLSSYIILLLNEHYDIKLELGNIYMNLGSLHIYSENIEQAKKCLSYRKQKFNYLALQPLTEFKHSIDLLNHLQAIFKPKPDELKSRWCANLAQKEIN